jgi:hypothetical protein
MPSTVLITKFAALKGEGAFTAHAAEEPSSMLLSGQTTLLTH